MVAAIGKDNIALEKKKQSALNKAVKRAVKTKPKVERKDAEAVPRPSRIIMLKHIPHGFYEKEMKRFFGQFGKVHRVRVARSKKTGKSRGYAFVEFEFEEVAKIAAESMNNYLMFERLIKCEVVSPDRNPSLIFRDRNIREDNFPKLKARAWVKNKQNKILSQSEKAEILKQRVEKLQEKNKRLAELGIDYSFPAPMVPEVSSSNNDEQMDSGDTSSEESEMMDEDVTSPIKVSPVKKQSPTTTTPGKRSIVYKSLSDFLEAGGKKKTPEKQQRLSGHMDAAIASSGKKKTPAKQQKRLPGFMEVGNSSGKKKTPEKQQRLSDLMDEVASSGNKSPRVYKSLSDFLEASGKKKTPEKQQRLSGLMETVTSSGKKKTPEKRQKRVSGLMEVVNSSGKKKTPENQQRLSGMMDAVTSSEKKSPLVHKSLSDFLKASRPIEKAKTPEKQQRLSGLMETVTSSGKKKTPEKQQKRLSGLMDAVTSSGKKKPKTPEQASLSSTPKDNSETLTKKSKKMQEKPKFSPKLLRSRKSQGPQQNVDFSSETPGKKDKSNLPRISPKLLRSRKSHGPAEVTSSTPGKKSKPSDLPKISPKMLRSRKSDASSLTPLAPKASAAPAKGKKMGRKSVF